MNEGAERAWFYVSIWTVVLAQIGSWGAWRLGGQMGLEKIELARLRLLVFLIITGFLSILGMMGRLPRTSRYYHDQDVPFNAEEMAE